MRLKKLILSSAIFCFSLSAFAQNWRNQIGNPNVNFTQTKKEFDAYWETHDPTKEKGYKPFKRWERKVAPYVMPDGRIGKVNPKNTISDFLKRTPNRGPVSWTALGPFDKTPSMYGIGRLWCFDLHPNNEQLVFGGTENGGLFKTDNGGSSWQEHVVSGLRFTNVQHIAFDPNNAQHLYIIGTVPSVSTSHRIFKSTDGGNSIQLATTFDFGSDIKFIRINPSNSQHIFVSSSNGLFRSLNGGTDWSSVSSTPAYDMEFTSVPVPTIYIQRYNETSREISYSTSNGDKNSWIQDVVVPSYTLIETEGNFLYRYEPYNQNSFKLFKKDIANSGNWNEVNPGHGAYFGHQLFYHNVFEVAPTSSNVIFLGSVNLQTTTDGGQSWSRATGIHVDFKQVKVIGNNTYAATDGGFYKSTDFGQTWQFLSQGLDITEIYKIDGIESQPNKLYAGTQDNSHFRYDNGVWSGFGSSDGMEIEVNPDHPNIQYKMIQHGTMAYTKDDWQTVQSLAGDISIEGLLVTPLTIDPSNSNVAYMGDKYLHRLESLQNSNGKPTNFTHKSILNTWNNKIAEIAVGHWGNTIYAMTEHELYYSMNKGQTWATYNIKGVVPEINRLVSMAVSFEDERKVYLSAQLTVGGSTQAQIYELGFHSVSSNAGTVATEHALAQSRGPEVVTINSIKANLPDHAIRCIEPINGLDNYLYIGTDEGIFYRTASTNTWHLMNGNLPICEISDIEINYHTGKIRVATYGRGVWETVHLNVGALKAVADFRASETKVCAGSSIQYTNETFGNPNFCYWLFPGGVPNYHIGLTPPPVTYNTPGKHTVTLYAGNSNGMGYKTKTDYIEVGGQIASSKTTYDFDQIPVGTKHQIGQWNSLTEEGQGWIVKDGPSSASPQIGPSSGRGGSGNFVTLIRSPQIDNSGMLMSPCIDLSGFSNPVLEFYYNINGYGSNNIRLTVGVIQDDNYEQLDFISLQPGPDNDLGDVWNRKQLDLSSYAGEVIQLSFHGFLSQFITADLALDDITIADAPVANFTYPNPVTVNQFVSFTDQSVDATTWEWTFEDASTSSSSTQNPGTSFVQTGSQKVTLMVKNSDGMTDQIEKWILVNPAIGIGPPFGGPIGMPPPTPENLSDAEDNWKESITVIPNPSQGLFAVQLPSDEIHDIQVLDGIGKVIYQTSASHQTLVDIRDLANGIYFLQIRSGEYMTTQKIVKQ